MKSTLSVTLILSLLMNLNSYGIDSLEVGSYTDFKNEFTSLNLNSTSRLNNKVLVPIGVTVFAVGLSIAFTGAYVGIETDNDGLLIGGLLVGFGIATIGSYILRINRANYSDKSLKERRKRNRKLRVSGG